MTRKLIEFPKNIIGRRSTLDRKDVLELAEKMAEDKLTTALIVIGLRKDGTVGIALEDNVYEDCFSAIGVLSYIIHNIERSLVKINND